MRAEGSAVSVLPTFNLPLLLFRSLVMCPLDGLFDRFPIRCNLSYTAIDNFFQLIRIQRGVRAVLFLGYPKGIYDVILLQVITPSQPLPASTLSRARNSVKHPASLQGSRGHVPCRLQGSGSPQPRRAHLLAGLR